jgi:glycosyltransferase involved in cell wall biosynthesis
VDEQIDHGETGYLVDPDDTAAVADAVTALLDDETERNWVSQAAAKQAREATSLDTLGRQVECGVQTLVN